MNKYLPSGNIFIMVLKYYVSRCKKIHIAEMMVNVAKIHKLAFKCKIMSYNIVLKIICLNSSTSKTDLLRQGVRA